MSKIFIFMWCLSLSSLEKVTSWFFLKIKHFITEISLFRRKKNRKIYYKPLQLIGSSSNSSKGNDKKPSDYQLKETQAYICDYTSNFFIMTLDQERYHQNMILDNRINGSVVQGLKYYNGYLGLVKLYGISRFVSVSSRVCNTYINEEQQSVTVHFRFFGLGFIETVLKFIPKQLYHKENALKEQRIWLEAVSTYYLDGDGKIVRHIVDDKDIDHDRVMKNPFERLKERLAKHIKTPAPATI